MRMKQVPFCFVALISCHVFCDFLFLPAADLASQHPPISCAAFFGTCLTSQLSHDLSPNSVYTKGSQRLQWRSQGRLQLCADENHQKTCLTLYKKIALSRARHGRSLRKVTNVLANLAFLMSMLFWGSLGGSQNATKMLPKWSLGADGFWTGLVRPPQKPLEGFLLVDPTEKGS